MSMNTESRAKLPTSFFELVRTSQRPVLVDFWAEWCAPCRMVSPSIERLAREYSGKILTVKVNVDSRPKIAETYQIESIPTIMLFWRGEAQMRLTGTFPYDSIRKGLIENWPKGAGQLPA
jgi:thioredoxin